MAQAVIMPKLGQAMEDATIVKWHKKEGDQVKKGEVLFEIETEKAVLEAESFHEGTLLKILVREQEAARVLSPVAYVGKPGEKLPEIPAALPTASSPPPSAVSRPEQPVKPRTASAAAMPEPARVTPGPTHIHGQGAEAVVPRKLAISPRAKALARASVINPANIRGTGPNGRIIERDVKAYLEEKRYDQIKITPAAKRLAADEDIDILNVSGAGESLRITARDIQRAIAEKPRKMSKMRQVIAKRLTESFTTTPHFYVTVSADMTELLAFRQELKERGESYTVTDFILEAVILSLLEFPALNSVTDGAVVRWHGSVALGVAVGLDDGLVVPVIRSSENLNMRELHESAGALAAKARSGKLTPDEMTGSTFTVSNMGMMDVENFTAIINPGESAILAVASTMQCPVAINGRVEARSMMKMTLSSDHRIVDGATAAAFINAVKHKLEDMELWKSLT